MATQIGYKASELGIIPQDWEIRRIGDFAPLQRGFDLPNSEIQSGDYPVVYSNGIGNYHNRYTVKSPCIATGRSGTLGKVHYVEQDCWVHNTSLWVTKFDNCEPKFIYFLFQKIGFERFASGSGVPTLNRNDAHEFKIALPKFIAEQTAIATALSDTDALISSLQTLIAKKQAVKLAAMQNLLGGKIHLPAFAQRPDGSPKTTRQTELGEVPEDWDVVELGEVGEPIIGLTYSPNDIDDNGVLVLRSSNIQSNKLVFDDNVFVKMAMPERVIVKENDILICVRNGSRQLIGKCALITKEAEGFAFGAFMSVFRTPFAPFIFYAFQSDKIQNQIKEIMGATINQITNKDLREFKIAIPKSTAEQTAIAQLLSDMDAEIEALEGRLKKTQSLKQGMMQALLSGKIRLPLK